MHFDHAGIATRDAGELAEQYETLLDAEVAHREEFDGMEIHFLDLGNGYFEVIEPLEDGPIARHLERDGACVHHIALETESVATALEEAREVGVRTIDDEPRPGAWGHTVAFLHPRDTGGVLLEFVEH